MELCGRLEAKNEPVCFINTDIILLGDFRDACRRLLPQLRNSDFMLTSERTDLELTGLIDFQPGWEQKLPHQVKNESISISPMGIDYFIFNNGLFDGTPDFLLGRGYWDNWLIYRVLSRGGMVVDCTGTVVAIHQNHDYSHVIGSSKDFIGIESEHNCQIAGHSHAFNIWDANYLYSDSGIVENPRIVTDPDAEIRRWLTRAGGRRLVIYGAGWRGKGWYRLLCDNNMECMIVDREWQSLRDDNYDVAGVQILDKKSDRYFVINTVDSSDAILTTLNSFGYDESSFLTAGRLTTERMDRILRSRCETSE